MTRKEKSISHVTLGPLENDARVRRAYDASLDAGFRSALIGPGRGFDLPAFSLLHKAKLGSLFGISARLHERAARHAFFAFPHHRIAADCVFRSSPDLIHAHDWDGAVIGSHVAAELKIPFIYDAHEFASDMHSERLLWRLTVAPLIKRMEKTVARQADLVISVSDLLGEVMYERFELKRWPLTIRNIPDIKIKASPCLDSRQSPHRLIHYHGILAKGRGIEVALDALELLPVSYRLRLTGPWRQESFKRQILTRISGGSLQKRVEIHDALPYTDLARHAADADIGLCLLSGQSIHDRGALPNKFFEYVNAGLAIICSGSQEMARIVADAGCGSALTDATPESIAQSILSWDDRSLKRMREASLQVAKKLTWDVEKRKLVRAWKALLGDC